MSRNTLIALVLLLGACGSEAPHGGPAGSGGEGGAAGGAGGGGAGGVGPVGEGVLEVEPAESCVDFGEVMPGEIQRRAITLRNTGTAAVAIAGVAMAPGSSSAFSRIGSAPASIPVDNPDTVEKENEITVPVLFSPTADHAGVQEGIVQIFFGTAAGNSTAEVCLAGVTAGPVIECTPRSIDFGAMALGETATRSFHCMNAGLDEGAGRTLYVTDVAIDAGFFSAAIRNSDGSPGPKPAGYAAGETFEIDVIFARSDEAIHTAEILVHSNDRNEPVYELAVSASPLEPPPCEFEVRPPSLRFGIVDAGKTAEAEFRVANVGDGACSIEDLRFAEGSDPAFTFTNGPISFANIAPRQELGVRIRFAPTEHREEAYGGGIEFGISDPARPVQAVPISGASVKPCIEIQPAELDFGIVAPNCAARERSLTIVDVCETPSIVTGIDIPADGGATDEFKVRRRPAGLDSGVSIAPGGQLEFTIAYVPLDLGADLGMVFVQTAEQPFPYMATLRGRGAADAIQTDRFLQEGASEVDVLFVVDAGSTMDPAQQRLAESVDSFLDAAVASPSDFQIGVIASGFCPGTEGSRLLPVDGSGPRILTRSTSNLAANLESKVEVGTCEASGALGLEAAWRALSSPLIDSADHPGYPEPNDGNLGFLRRDANLAVVFVSDGEDQSPQSTTFYRNFFDSLKGLQNSDMVSIHAVAGDWQQGCDDGVVRADAGDRYTGLAAATGGVSGSICAADWSTTMERIADRALGHRFRFSLSSQPEDTNLDGRICDHDCDRDGTADQEIQVRLDGVLTPSVKGNGARVWFFDMAANALSFMNGFVPPPGTEIEISYKVPCLLP